MKDTGNLQGVGLCQVLVWAACLCGPAAQAFAAQPQEFTVSPTATTTRGQWVATGNLNVARWEHTATLLPNGNVLVTGGRPGSGGAEFAESYDPIAGTWTRTGDEACMPEWHRTATLLSNGKVLVAGEGCAELYDPATGTWTRTGDMVVWRNAHKANRLADGRVLVVGGIFTPSSAEIYDPSTGMWTLTGALAQDRGVDFTSTTLRDGRVLVAGGYHYVDTGWDDCCALSSTEIFDPRNGTWTSAGELAFARLGHTATLLPSGKVLIVGGGIGASEIFDPATGTSSAIANLNYGGGSEHQATAMSNGDVLVSGGRSNPEGYAEVYDTASGSWLPAGQQTGSRFAHTATLLQDGRVLLAGGYRFASDFRSGEFLASAEFYLPPPGSIGPGFTGSWYDPAQIGHGLFVEVLPDNKFLAAWFTFDPSGTQQSWFLGVGTYSGDTATINSVVQPAGGRWIPNFDPSRVVNIPWGTLKFTFTDCNHGRVEFVSSSGYGTGSMNLTRLTQPVGLTCP